MRKSHRSSLNFVRDSGGARAARVRRYTYGAVGLAFFLTLSPAALAGIVWQGPPSELTFTDVKVLKGIPISDEGFNYAQSLPDGLAIAGPFLIQDAPDQTQIDFSMTAVRNFLYTGGKYTTTVSGSATFSYNVQIGGDGYVSIFSIYNGSIYTQDGFVTPAGTASTSKAPGNVPIISSPNIPLPANTTKPWELTPKVGYEASLGLLVVMDGLTPGEIVSVDFPVNVTLAAVPEPYPLLLASLALRVCRPWGGWRAS